MAIETILYSGVNDDVANEANTGFDGIQILDPGGSMLFDDEWMPRGRMSIISTGSEQQGHVLGWFDVEPTDTFSFDIPWRPIVVGSTPNADNQILMIGAGETRCLQINTLNTGALRIRDGGAVQTTSPTGLFPAAAGESFILAVSIIRHATAGSWRVVLYKQDHQTVVWDSGIISGVNTGPSAISRVRTLIGKQGTTSVTPARHAWGEPRWDVESSAILPRFAPPNPFWMWINGQYEQVAVYFWDPTIAGYTQIGV